ncbi:MAG: HAMP domain-containing protein, partial [Oscillochloris sp.]|nr:HAMP domain-containing protein [Oscillochloris sp.]
MSLTRRLTITHALVAVLAVLLMSLLASGLIVRAYRQAARDQAIQQGRVIAERLRGPLAQLYINNRGWPGAAARLGDRLADLGGVDGRLVLADDNGRVVFDSNDQLVGRPLPINLRTLALPVVVRGQVVGLLVVVPSSEAQQVADRTFIRSIAFIVLGGSLFAVLGSTVIAFLVAGRLTRPLRSLTMAARRLAAGERHEPLVAPVDTELAELARAFNRMAAELGRQEELRRAMVADIAHELRTPLSVVRLQVESMEDGITPSSPQTLAALGSELDLLGRLIDDLRLLSIADAGQLSLRLTAIDPWAALDAARRAAEPHALRRGVRLEMAEMTTLPPIKADPQRLAQILGNLIENGLRYTPVGGTVTLAASRSHN